MTYTKRVASILIFIWIELVTNSFTIIRQSDPLDSIKFPVILITRPSMLGFRSVCSAATMAVSASAAETRRAISHLVRGGARRCAEVPKLGDAGRKRALRSVNVCASGVHVAFKTGGGSCDSSHQFAVDPHPQLFGRKRSAHSRAHSVPFSRPPSG